MISKHAVVETSKLGSNVRIAEFSVVRDGAVIGNNVVIHEHVVINSGVVIGDDVEIFSGAVVGKQPKATSAISRELDFDSSTVVGNGSTIGVHAVLYYDVILGENVLIADGASVREKCRIGDKSIIGRYATLNYNVVVGKSTRVMDHVWLAGNMTIGDGVFISGGVLTANDNSFGRGDYDEADIVGPNIGDRSAIGVGAVLLPHVTIGRDCTVAAGAVVTKDIADGQTVKGIPAK